MPTPSLIPLILMSVTHKQRAKAWKSLISMCVLQNVGSASRHLLMEMAINRDIYIQYLHRLNKMLRAVLCYSEYWDQLWLPLKVTGRPFLTPIVLTFLV